jgi:hypothetical protein
VNVFYLLINPLSCQLPNGKPKLFFLLLLRGYGAVPDIRINFHQEITTYNHGFAFWMVDVIWNNGTASGNFLRTNSGVIFPPFSVGVCKTISFVLALHGFGLFVY